MLMSKVRACQSGFNIVEMMITITVLAIVLSIAAPMYTQFIASTQVRSVAESIRNGLQLARTEAVKRNMTVTFTLNDDTSWSVRCATCATDIQAKSAHEGSSGAVTLDSTGTVTFTSLGITDGAVGQLSEIGLDSSTSGAKALRITINAGGSVKVCEPSMTVATDPRYCS